VNSGRVRFPGLGPGDAPVLQRDGGVVESGSPWQQQVALRHERAPGQAVLGGRGSLDVDLTGIRLHQPGHDMQQRGLAAAAWPHNPDPGVRGISKSNSAQGDYFAEPLADAPEMDADAVAGYRARGTVAPFLTARLAPLPIPPGAEDLIF
jgi:hypothetical protein